MMASAMMVSHNKVQYMVLCFFQVYGHRGSGYVYLTIPFYWYRNE